MVQMEGVDFFTPNTDTHPAFGEALKRAAATGVKVTAWDCHVESSSISIQREVPVVLGERTLYEIRRPLIHWYRENKRDLPWRENPDAYRVWVSEIMLQQTRVAAVVGYFTRFLEAFPTVQALAEAPEDQLMKLWQGLGTIAGPGTCKRPPGRLWTSSAGPSPRPTRTCEAWRGWGSTPPPPLLHRLWQPVPAVDGNLLRVAARVMGMTPISPPPRGSATLPKPSRR